MDGESLSSLQIETGIQEWLLEMDLENSRRVVKKQVPAVPLYQLLDEQETCHPCGGIRLAWGHLCPYSGHCSQEKVRHLSPISALGSVGGFIMSLWTCSQKYVFHWLGRSEEVPWLCLEQSGPGIDPHGLMTENPVRISLSQWVNILYYFPPTAKSQQYRKKPSMVLGIYVQFWGEGEREHELTDFPIQWLCTWLYMNQPLSPFGGNL